MIRIVIDAADMVTICIVANVIAVAIVCRAAIAVAVANVMIMK